MSIIKNEIPILEFDSEQSAVINPTHERLDIHLPKKCVFAFLGDYIDGYAHKTDTRKVSSFISATKHYPIYITKYKGEEIVLCQAPVGAAPATQIQKICRNYLGNSLRFVILFVCKKLYGRTIKDILGTQGSKKALIAGLGMVLVCIYSAVVEVVTIKKIGGLTGGK